MGRDPADEAFLAPLMARARDSLGGDAYREAETEGRAAGPERGLGEARIWLESAKGAAKSAPELLSR